MVRLHVQLYVENILALEAKAKATGRGTGRPLPLAIMTSDDTHTATQQLLTEHDHFGAVPEQIHLLKQEKVSVHTADAGQNVWYIKLFHANVCHLVHVNS
jgi:UDP-N-acetylglucosamine pyrophosphorylase